jgi:catechol 2,3-dioxygenase-like lactoylglutathione lyase family enzyme
MKVTVPWFSVNDFEQTKKFYSDVLGLKEIFATQGWAEFAEAIAVMTKRTMSKVRH